MAPHSSTLDWKIPWMEESGRLQSMRLLRVRHDWATSLSLLLVLSSIPFPYLGCSKAVSIVSFGDHDNGIARDCPYYILALKEKLWLIRGRCIIISHSPTIRTICWFIYLRDSMHSLLEINIFIKPAIFKIFNSFVLRLCSFSYIWK